MISKFFLKLKRIFLLPALRDRILYTFLMFLVIRIGVHIPIPGVDVFKLKALAQGGVADFINLVSGGAFSRASIFTLSIIPYINASIIIYISTLIFPKLEEMQREGGSEKEKLTQWTRYLAIGISIVHSIAAVTFLQSRGLVENPGMTFYISSILILTASVTFLTWVGDQITSKGIGNGISLIIFLGIVSRVPAYAIRLFREGTESNISLLKVLGICFFVVLLTLAIVAFQTAIRKIPVFYASGRGASIATKSYLPMRINNAGVMPIIFAGMITSVPSMVINLLSDEWSIKIMFVRWFSIDHPIYMIFYFATVLFFTFYYTSIVFDPEKIADNLKRSGANIPGVRPGNETIEYLDRIITRITLGGAIFLATIAVLPFVMNIFLGASFGIGGTGILIAVGVAIETIQQIEGALAMEEYGDFI